MGLVIIFVAIKDRIYLPCSFPFCSQNLFHSFVLEINLIVGIMSYLFGQPVVSFQVDFVMEILSKLVNRQVPTVTAYVFQI